MKYLLFLSILVCLSCAGNHCIELNGEWKGIDGGFKYCFDSTSQSASRPILTSEQGNKAVLLTEQDIQNITDTIYTKTFANTLGTKSLENNLNFILKEVEKNKESSHVNIKNQ